jgi:dihydroxy-acid dehydratase
VDHRRLDLELEEAEIQRRLEAYEPPPTLTRGVLGKYAQLVSSASEGAITQR